ncbi:hypothetical protein J5N97_002349 [Dioscorea zingiberensis]|uniref:FHA domain-containing protein n=1 Tax=Dioscorea zingiberensis TaxID=325984 RepID=A0A9D5D4K9_9LILI|nr:hypothetical protein J5N97_002349 [Dioscorea zingiberensis]
MGALAPLTKWIPEDDLLLKNAVEAGASLESLAKGAVCFSRRYTIKELQDRWRSLLYDSETSAEASARIIEIEFELSVSNAPKANRILCFKGKENPGKRKGDSVRNHYHALRKRVCGEPHCSADLGFLVQPSSLACPGITGGQQNLKSHTSGILNCHATANSSKLQEDFLNRHRNLDVDAAYAFPGMPIIDSATVNDKIASDAFHTGHMKAVSDDFPVQIADNDCVCPLVVPSVDSGAVNDNIATGAFHTGHNIATDERHTGHTKAINDDFSVQIADKDCIFPLVTPSGDKLEGENARLPLQHDFMQNDVSQIVREDLCSPIICQGVQEIGLPQTLQTSNTYGNDSMKSENVHDFDSTLGDHRYCGFNGNDSLISQVPECSDSLHQLGYSSPQPDVPSMWGTMNDISTSTFAIDSHFEVNQGAEALLDFDGIKEMHSPGCHGTMSETELNDDISDGPLNTSIAESDYMDISGSFINFADDELLLINMDEKDIVENSFNGLNSILLSSPNNTHQGDSCNSTELGTTEVVDACLTIPKDASLGKSSDLHEQKSNDQAGKDSMCISGGNASSTSPKISHNAQSCEGFVLCVLNTEDPEIPCNDHIFIPDQLFTQSPVFEFNPTEKPSSVSPSTETLETGKTNVQPTAQPFVSSLKTGLTMLSSVGLRHSSDSCRLEAEAIGNKSWASVSRHAGVAFVDPNSRTSINVSLQSGSNSALKEESVALNMGKHDDFDSFAKKPVQSYDLEKLYPSNIADNCKQEADMQDEMQEHMVYQPQSSGEMLVKNSEKFTSELDQDHLSDSENDVPNFSDVEAMVLDMDLGPYDQEPYLFTKAVSRYQCLDTKKNIIRLEQGAHSYMQRAITHHGAFAVFYGRHLKYYIKSPKVLLGRATEGVKVDIDLGREEHTKKISRRQAIIKLVQDGLFFLTNVGKGSIFVNSKEVPSGKRINLISGCLIEIRGMRFIFEVNQTATSQYLCSSQGSNQEQNTKLE